MGAHDKVFFLGECVYVCVEENSVLIFGDGGWEWIFKMYVFVCVCVFTRMVPLTFGDEHGNGFTKDINFK